MISVQVKVRQYRNELPSQSRAQILGYVACPLIKMLRNKYSTIMTSAISSLVGISVKQIIYIALSVSRSIMATLITFLPISEKEAKKTLFFLNDLSTPTP